ncbi:MAG: DUF2950 domain-containing protein [Candidatus Binataceae bacterium]
MMRTGWNGLGVVWWLGIAALSVAATLSTAGARAFDTGAQQATFSAPERAVEALIAANRSANTAELVKILGPESEKLVSSGDPVADTAGRNRFIAAYDVSHKLDSRGADKAVLVVGKEDWPLPIPLVREGSVWRFDTKAGEKEILDRRIGRNELKVIEVCRAYVEAQREYAAKDRLGSGHLEYAQHLLSTSGKHDGLYWATGAGEEQSPLGPLIAKARAAGYFAKDNESSPFYGYYYKILTRQGPNAPGGAKDYIVDGHMTGGFGLLTFPARYGDSGIMTFIVNQNGIVSQKDLGPETASTAGNMTQFDPDATWKTP